VFVELLNLYRDAVLHDTERVELVKLLELKITKNRLRQSAAPVFLSDKIR